MSETTTIERDPMVGYERARRNKHVNQRKFNTTYGKFVFATGTDHEDNELNTNLTHVYYDGPWLREIPVGIRNRMAKLRWIDCGTKTGWFPFKLVHGLMPKVVYAFESSPSRFSFLRKNHSQNDRNGVIASIFKHLVIKKEYGIHNTEINIDTETGYASVDGTERAIVPLAEFGDFVTKHNINAVRFDFGGYEKELLLNANLKGFKMVLAVIEEKHYSKKEMNKLKKKLNNLFVVKYNLEEEGIVRIMAYKKEMIA